MEDIKAVIAGGGTGGHLFPGIAVAKELERRFENAEIIFVVGRRKIESEIMARYGYQVASIDIEGLMGRGWKKAFKVLIKLPMSIMQSISIINKYSPQFVLGMGGYSSGPFCIAARFKGLPTAIHEQNSYPGLTNRLLSRFVDRVMASFEESMVHFKARSLSLTGNPVRKDILCHEGEKKDDSSGFSILVVGGSQGARAINEAFIEALTLLNRKGRNPGIVHQTGQDDYESVSEKYRKIGIRGKVIPFIQDMAEAYNGADIVVSRAGATTVAELAALGKASILIPYPYAANQHQDTNAMSLVKIGGAEMVKQKDLSGEYLAMTLLRYMNDQVALREMGAQARKVGKRNAAEIIVDQLIEMIA